MTNWFSVAFLITIKTPYFVKPHADEGLRKHAKKTIWCHFYKVLTKNCVFFRERSPSKLFHWRSLSKLNLCRRGRHNPPPPKSAAVATSIDFLKSFLMWFVNIKLSQALCLKLRTAAGFYKLLPSYYKIIVFDLFRGGYSLILIELLFVIQRAFRNFEGRSEKIKVIKLVKI